MGMQVVISEAEKAGHELISWFEKCPMLTALNRKEISSRFYQARENGDNEAMKKFFTMLQLDTELQMLFYSFQKGSGSFRFKPLQKKPNGMLND